MAIYPKIQYPMKAKTEYVNPIRTLGSEDLDKVSLFEALQLIEAQAICFYRETSRAYAFRQLKGALNSINYGGQPTSPANPPMTPAEIAGHARNGGTFRYDPNNNSYWAEDPRVECSCKSHFAAFKRHADRCPLKD